MVWALISIPVNALCVSCLKTSQEWKNLFLHGSNSIKIAEKANSYIGETQWAFSSKRRTGLNTNKDFIFVAEVIEWAGASVPHRFVLVESIWYMNPRLEHIVLIPKAESIFNAGEVWFGGLVANEPIWTNVKQNSFDENYWEGTNCLLNPAETEKPKRQTAWIVSFSF